MRGASASLMSSVITVFLSPEFTLGNPDTELGNLNAIGVIRSWDSRGQVVAWNSPKARWTWLPSWT